MASFLTSTISRRILLNNHTPIRRTFALRSRRKRQNVSVYKNNNEKSSSFKNKSDPEIAEQERIKLLNTIKSIL